VLTLDPEEARQPGWCPVAQFPSTGDQTFLHVCVLCQWLEPLDKESFDFFYLLKHHPPLLFYLFIYLFIYFDRNFELAKLQYKHLVENAWTKDGYHFQHLLVTLENQKGWQSKLSKEWTCGVSFHFMKCAIFG